MRHCAIRQLLCNRRFQPRKLNWVALVVGVLLAGLAQAGPIHDAARAGNLTALQQLVAQSADPRKVINEQDDQGYSALHWAVAEGKIELVPWLLKNGADVHLRNRVGETPLLLAGKHGRPQTAIYLIEAGAKVNDVVRYRLDSSSLYYYFYYGSQMSVTPVGLAAANGHPEVIGVLLDRGANIRGVESDGMAGYPVQYERPEPIEMAVRNGHRQVVKLLVERGGENENAVWTAIKGKHRDMLEYLFDLGMKAGPQSMHLAVEQSDVSLIEYLLSRGSTVDSHSVLSAIHKNDMQLLTFLLGRIKRDQYIEVLNGLSHQANFYFGASVPSVAVMRILLDHDPEAIRKVPTLLHAAATSRATEVVNLLLAHGLAVNARDDFGNTALHWAAQVGHPETARLLLDRGADIMARSDWGNTPLHRAVPWGQTEVVRLLVERGADVNAVNETGATPLHMAAVRGHVEIMRLLLGKGARVTAENQHGLQPVHAAAASGNPQAMQLLLDRGANPRATSKLGTTALHHAITGHYSYYQYEGKWSGSRPSDGPHHSPERPEAKPGERLKLVQLLIDRKADVNARSEYFATPLHLAVVERYQPGAFGRYCCHDYYGPFRNIRDQLAVIGQLLQAGADPHAHDSASPPLTPLELAGFMRDRKAVADLLRSAAKWGAAAGKSPAASAPSQSLP